MNKQNNRELTRQFKQTLRPMGVYVIRNLKNGCVYVGGSTELEGQMNRDRMELRLKGHRNTSLMQDWLLFGAEHFHFEVIDTVKQHDDPAFDYKTEVASLLEMWREELQSYGERGYNARTAKASAMQRAMALDAPGRCPEDRTAVRSTEVFE
jgi:hypothetical protein